MASAVSPPQPSSVRTPPALTSCAIPSAKRAPPRAASNGRPSAGDEPHAAARSPPASGRAGAVRRGRRWSRPAAGQPLDLGEGDRVVRADREQDRRHAAGAPGPTSAPAASRRATAAASPAAPTSSAGGPSSARPQRGVEVGVGRGCPVPRARGRSPRQPPPRRSARRPRCRSGGRPTTVRPCAGIAGATSARAAPRARGEDGDLVGHMALEAGVHLLEHDLRHARRRRRAPQRPPPAPPPRCPRARRC